MRTASSLPLARWLVSFFASVAVHHQVARPDVPGDDLATVKILRVNKECTLSQFIDGISGRLFRVLG